MRKNNQEYIVKIANKHIRCSFEFLETASFFSDYLVDFDYQDKEVVKIDDYDKELWSSTGNTLDAYGEYSLLCGGISDNLLHHGSCLIHAVAFRYENRAYLIVAPPGVGKSTQIQYLMNLYPDQFSVICGDRPCLSLEENGRIFVYPTPWNGKENWHGAESCELAAVFYLKRGDITEITQLDNKAAILPVFSSLISRREREEDIQYLGNYTEQILEHYPVYLYINGGVPESTVIFYDTISSEVISDEI